MQKSPPPFIWACPDEKNILDCELNCKLSISSHRRALHHCQLILTARRS